VDQNAQAYIHASNQLKNDEQIALAAMREDGLLLQWANILQNNRRVVLAAMDQNAQAFIYASDPLKNDEQIVLAAVMKNGLLLQWATPFMQNNRNVVVAAIAQNPGALRFASPAMRHLLNPMPQPAYAF